MDCLFADYGAGKTRRKKTKTERGGARPKTAPGRGRSGKTSQNRTKTQPAGDDQPPPAPPPPPRQTHKGRSNASADLLTTAIPPLASSSVAIKKRSKTALFSECIKKLVEKALQELVRT
jgi:hypothetical protein